MFPHFLVLNIGQGCTVPLEEMNIDFPKQGWNSILWKNESRLNVI